MGRPSVSCDSRQTRKRSSVEKLHNMHKGSVSKAPSPLVACINWSPNLPAWNRVRIPFLAWSPKVPVCSGYSALQTGKSLLQAGKFGLERGGKLESMLQVGRFGLRISRKNRPSRSSAGAALQLRLFRRSAVEKPCREPAKHIHNVRLADDHSR